MTLHYQSGSVRKLAKQTEIGRFAPAQLAEDWLALHAENEKLRAALELIAQGDLRAFATGRNTWAESAVLCAHAALGHPEVP